MNASDILEQLRKFFVGADSKVITAGHTVMPCVEIESDVTLHGLEHLMHEPVRPRGMMAVGDFDSFVYLVNRFDTDGTLASVYIERTTGHIVALLNDNEVDGAGWRDFGIVLKTRLHKEWQEWKTLDGQWLGQVSLAEFIQDHLINFIDPDGPTMFALAREITVTSSGKYTAACNLINGNFQISIQQESKATANIEFPSMLQVGVPIFATSLNKTEIKTYKFPVRFRYRPPGDDKLLMLGFEIINIDALVEQAIADLIAATRKALPKQDKKKRIVISEGTPGSTPRITV